MGARYGAATVYSEEAEFRCHREEGDVEFLVLGDTGAGVDDQYAVAAMLQRERPDFVLHTGDIVYPAFTAGKCDLRCLSIYEAQMRSVPWYFTLGNHDINGGDLAYQDVLWQPTNVETGSELFYSFDHGDVHVACLFVPWWGMSRIGEIGLDGSRSAQYRWLVRDLSNSTKPWKVVFFHQPPKTSGPHSYDDYDLDGRRDTQQMQEALIPLLAELGVDVVFNGHDHNWERFPPVRGVHCVVTGGGGAPTYGIYRREPGSARQASVHHAARVRTGAGRMMIEAVDVNGLVFDQVVLGRERAEAVGSILDSTWHEREHDSESERVSNGDGNWIGERFDLVGGEWTSVPGVRANLGRLLVNEDAEFIHLGVRDAMVWADQTVVLWIGSPRQAGVTNLADVGTASRHPLADLGLTFDGFQPCWVALLGDEWADGTSAGFGRLPQDVPLGQGVFRLGATLAPVISARVQQFNRSPEGLPDIDEQNADFMVISIPRAELGGVLPGDELAVAAVVVAPTGVETVGGRLALDTAYLGAALVQGGGAARATLSPLRVRLALPPDGDEDLDGLTRAREMELGTDPLNPDTDRDGLPDGWEVAHGLGATVASGADGGEGDPDADGYLNLEELRSGTDPRDGRSTLVVVAERVGPAGITLRWRAMVGRRYAVETSDALSAGFREMLIGGFPREARSTNESVVFLLPPGPEAAASRWYRLRDLGRAR
ncbi:MAG: metallophosphoesterase [Verrucomicrobiales bacterium]|nr:metallophosphoesterase [Verrucomicrobiales bacterium]